MLFTTEGIVIHERSVGENDKYIDVLTKDLGVIEASIKGVKKLTSKNSSSTQLFAYSKLCFAKRGEKYYLNSSEPIKVFYDLRLDLEKFALASYFAEIIRFSVVSEEPSEMVLRLFLNTLHFLTQGMLSLLFLKSIFELRFMTEIGLMPDLVACKNCMEYYSEKMLFFISEGYFLCDDCYNSVVNDNIVPINKAVLHTMRYIIFSEFDKLYSFKISDTAQKKLSLITERYLISHLNRNFKTLEFFKSL